MSFEQGLRFWLMGHGVSEAGCDKVCADRRVAMNIKLQDEGGMVQDIGLALYSLGDEGLAVRAAVNDAGEQLLLMMHLRDVKEGRSLLTRDAPGGSIASALMTKKATPKAARPPKPSARRTLVLQLTDAEGENVWTAYAGKRKFSLTREDVDRLLAPCAVVEHIMLWLPRPPTMPLPYVEYDYKVDADGLVNWLRNDIGFDDVRNTSPEVNTAAEGAPSSLDIELSLTGEEYLAFFEAKGVVR